LVFKLWGVAYALGIQTLGSGLRAWYSAIPYSLLGHALAVVLAVVLAVTLAVTLAVVLAVTLAQIDPKGMENTRVGIHTRDVG
jgi:hypothetical protein